MDRIQLTKNFFLDEYIPRNHYIRYQHKPHILKNMINPQLVIIDQKLRDKFGSSITINNYWGMSESEFNIKYENETVRNWSGRRTPFLVPFRDAIQLTDYKDYVNPYFSEFSSHSIGNVSDKIFKGVTAEEVIQYIQKNWKELGVTELELGTTWVHSGIRRGAKSLYSYKP